MARLERYSGETPQGEEASAAFLQLFAQKKPSPLPFAAILSPKAA
jgi:hypothetical protein